MRFLFTFLIFCMTISFLFSQEKYRPVTAIYKITDTEAKELHLSKLDTIGEKYFHTLVDTTTKSYPYNQSETGYYLFAKADKEDLSVVLEGTHSISAVSVVNERDLAIQVVDSLGQMIEDAQITFQRKDKL